MQADPARADDRKRLEAILAQSDRLGRLVSRLLDVSRAEMGRLDLALAETDAAMVVRRTVDAARGLSGAHELQVDTPDELPVVWDEVRIEQVLTNLVSNAIRYTPGGIVRVTVDLTEDDWVRIGVRDHGQGIPEPLQLRLFDRYVRGRGRERHEGSGLGLGLYISRLIAQAHGGNLSATNVEDGGALFTLTLPRASGTTPPPGQRAVSATA
jgi:signal transduction histidine kinase